MLQANDATPLYKQIKIALKNDILNKRYAPGDKIPSEPELRERFGVSRVTVRYAVQELEDEGFLQRRQGKGTFVMHEKIESNMGSLSGFTDVIGAVGGKPERRILSKKIITAGDWLADNLRVPYGAPILELERAMSDDQQPVLYDLSYYPLELFPGLDEKIEHNVSSYRVLKEEYGVVFGRAHKRINVEIADVSFSRLLGCNPGDPLFSILKTAYDKDDVPVHMAKNLVMANHITYVLDVREGDNNGAFQPHRVHPDSR